MLTQEKYTKWNALSSYESGGNEFVVIARANTKTGMIYFRVKKLNGSSLSHGTIGLHKVLDIETQWKELIAMLN